MVLVCVHGAWSCLLYYCLQVWITCKKYWICLDEAPVPPARPRLLIWCRTGSISAASPQKMIEQWKTIQVGWWDGLCSLITLSPPFPRFWGGNKEDRQARSFLSNFVGLQLGIDSCRNSSLLWAPNFALGSRVGLDSACGFDGSWCWL